MDTEMNILDLTGVETLTSVQLNFIKAVMVGNTISAAALASGVSRRTATTWMQPGHTVRQAYERAKAQYSMSVFERLKHIQLATLDALEACLSPDAPPAVRFNTAKFLYGIQFNAYGQPRNLPQDPDDCPQPRQHSKTDYEGFLHVFYEGLTDQEITLIEEKLAGYQKSQEMRNTGYCETIDLAALTGEEAKEFELLMNDLEAKRSVRIGILSAEEAEEMRVEGIADIHKTYANK